MAQTNWSGTYTFRAGTWHRPTSVEQLQELIARAAGPLHAVGTRHSFNDVADATEIIEVTGLTGEPVLDEAAATVRVPAATRYGDLAGWLHERGWALANLASLPHISVAGSVATATHGSGNDNQTLASAVVSMTLVTGTGEVTTLSEGDDGFDGAVIHLGALGVVSDLTLRLQPSFDVRQDVYLDLPWDSLTGDFEAVLGSGYSVSAITNFADPTVDLLWVKTRLRDGEPTTVPSERFGAVAATEKMHLTRGNDPTFTTPQLGSVGPWSDRLAHFLLEFTPSSGAEIQTEYLMDRQHAPAAIEALRGLGEPIAAAVKSAEIRTMAADELWLSPAYGRPTFGVHFTWLPDEPVVRALVERIEQALAPFAPRPHWGKVAGPDHDYRALYPRLADFAALVARFDPDGRFRSAFVRRVLDNS